MKSNNAAASPHYCVLCTYQILWLMTGSCGSVGAELNLPFIHANLIDIGGKLQTAHAISETRDKEIYIMPLNYM